MIGIVNYGMGNLWSVKRKLELIKTSSIITDKRAELKKCDKLILPGVGHFSNAVHELKARDLWDFLNEEVLFYKKPILGICLGMQLMAKHSEEGDTNGFGWFDAEVVRFNITDTLKYKIPHIGWNQVHLKRGSSVFKGVDLKMGFYFVHSFHIKCKSPQDILNETVYEYSFVSAIQKDNIIGIQYHPEKSHEAGEKLLSNFVNSF